MNKALSLIFACILTTLFPLSAKGTLAVFKKVKPNWYAAGTTGSSGTLLALAALKSYKEYRKVLREIALAQIDAHYAKTASDHEIAKVRNASLQRRKKNAQRKALFLGIPASLLGLSAAGFTANGIWQASQPDPNKKMKMRQVVSG